jgi:hypothetical protein
MQERNSYVSHSIGWVLSNPWIAPPTVAVVAHSECTADERYLSAKGRDGHRDQRVVAPPLATELTGVDVGRLVRSTYRPGLTA